MTTPRLLAIAAAIAFGVGFVLVVVSGTTLTPDETWGCLFAGLCLLAASVA